MLHNPHSGFILHPDQAAAMNFPGSMYSSGFLHDLVSDAMDTKLAEYNVAPLKIFMKLRTCGLIGGVGSSPKA